MQAHNGWGCRNYFDSKFICTLNSMYGILIDHITQKPPVNTTASLLIAPLFLCTAHALAQSVDPEPAAISELGGAASKNLKGGVPVFGPTVAMEVAPIQHWLELEAGITPTFNRHSTEWNADLLFKKPWTFSEKVEFMFGVGPEWFHARESGTTTNSLGGEVVVDFMFWPSGRRPFGWYVERIRPTNPGQRRDAAQRAGVRQATSETLRRAKPGNTASRYSFTGTSSRRQD